MINDILLTGTPVVPDAPRILSAGSLEVIYSAGSLRWVRWKGIEILRGISFLVRTPGWGTPAASISGLKITESHTDFSISYKAHYGTSGKGVSVAICIKGDAVGRLVADATICAEASFKTNRSGFVILHPLDGFAGTRVSVDHYSAPAQDKTISLQISPSQPVMDMRAITHSPVKGLKVETSFAGDIFEMEDQRNWTDASFKTYNRPIDLPYPYVLSPDETIHQSVKVNVHDTGMDILPKPTINLPEIVKQRMPYFALPLDTPADAACALHFAELVKCLAPASLLLRVDLSTTNDEKDYKAITQLMKLTGADLEVQVIFTASNATDLMRELKTLSGLMTSAGISVARVSAFSKIDEQSFQPNEDRPQHPSESTVTDALSLYFPQATKIGGTPAFFTELNRKRLTTSHWDGMTFATSPLVHAADDASVMETLESLSHVLYSANALANGLPISVGPVGIGLRLNPYGSAPVKNDPLAREEMAAHDPRQRGLFAAAWIVGYLTRIAPFSVDRFSFGAPTGPFGLISDKQDYPRPVWDDLGDGELFPLYHVTRWIAAAGGALLLRADTHDDIACLVWKHDGHRSALIANLSKLQRDVPQINLTNPVGVYLDASNLSGMSEDVTPLETGKSLDAYAVLYLREATS